MHMAAGMNVVVQAYAHKQMTAPNKHLTDSTQVLAKFNHSPISNDIYMTNRLTLRKH